MPSRDKMNAILSNGSIGSCFRSTEMTANSTLILDVCIRSNNTRTALASNIYIVKICPRTNTVDV